VLRGVGASVVAGGGVAAAKEIYQEAAG
jgi:hypothetical protein